VGGGAGGRPVLTLAHGQGALRATWAEAHHRTQWSHGGSTDVHDADLFCPWHHHRAHDPAYDLTRLPDGGVRFHRRT
jgi:hypothetical protein